MYVFILMQLCCLELWGLYLDGRSPPQKPKILITAYKTKHFWTPNLQKAYIYKGLELLWNSNIKKRFAR